jgi:ubiquinone/menaquinone biosynthesis C-methylase UbiE/uncharacterized protein YbaR (Trm112 family)
MKEIPANYIICPSCKNRVEKHYGYYICKKCGSSFPVYDKIPMLLTKCSKTKEKIYSRVWTEDSWELLLDRGPAINDFKESILPKFKKYLRGKVLEVGAGICWASALVKLENPNCKVFASDISLDRLKKGIKTCNFFGAKIDYFVVCDIENLPFNNNFFDCVLGLSVLNYISDLRNGIKEIERVLKPRGIFIGKARMWSNITQSLYRKFLHLKYLKEKFGFSINSYSLNFWRKIFLQNGFKNISIMICKNPRYHSPTSRNFTQKHFLYYTIIQNFPDWLIRNFLGSEIHIFAQK